MKAEDDDVGVTPFWFGVIETEGAESSAIHSDLPQVGLRDDGFEGPSTTLGKLPFCKRLQLAEDLPHQMSTLHFQTAPFQSPRPESFIYDLRDLALHVNRAKTSTVHGSGHRPG